MSSHEIDSRQRRQSVARKFRTLILASLMVASFGAGVAADRIVWDGGVPAGASSSLVDQPAFETFQDVWDLIHNNYVDTDGIDDDALLYGAASGMLDTLGDTNHTVFLDPERAKQYDQLETGEFVGIGVSLDASESPPVIISVVHGSPADKGGIQANDLLLEINGESTERMSAVHVSGLLRGDEGTEVTLTLVHEGADEPYTVTITRAVIEIEAVTWSMLPDDVALVRLNQFLASSGRDIGAALDAAKSEGARAIVLDLRGNPGGYVHEAIGVASQFLPEGSTIYLHQNRDSDPNPVPTVGGGKGLDLPMVVLINGGSASASEVVAAAFQDHRRATLIGEQTAGTGTLITPYKLEDGSIAMIGTAFWLTPNGERLWHVGVTPDLEVALPAGARELDAGADSRITRAQLAASSDVQLQTAYNQVLDVLDSADQGVSASAAD
jgi:carboxyl-terminal processing protease